MHINIYFRGNRTNEKGRNCVNICKFVENEISMFKRLYEGKDADQRNRKKIAAPSKLLTENRLGSRILIDSSSTFVENEICWN